MNYEAPRKAMVEEQLLRRGIKNERLLRAFSKVERHRFVSRDLMSNAYLDFPLSIGEGQTISQPYIVALMTEYLELTGNEKVLEIGTGSGYQTAILAELAKEVCSIERLPHLAAKAENLLKEMGYTNIKIKVGDGASGWPQQAPFDRIIITAAALQVPFALREQLKETGKIIAPLGEAFNQVLTLIEKKEGRFESTDICGCVFVPLISKSPEE